MDLNARVHVIEYPITNTAKDTEVMIQRFKQAGCHTVVSLGGDGTNRAIVGASSDLDLIPISTGTNNVFPMLVRTNHRRHGGRPQRAWCFGRCKRWSETGR